MHITSRACFQFFYDVYGHLAAVARSLLVMLCVMTSFFFTASVIKSLSIDYCKFLFYIFFHSFVLSLADVDPQLMMEDESLVWTSKDVVIVLEHQNEKIPLR